jgi:Zinc-binding dehydrogenase
MVREPDATRQLTPQDNQLMSKHRVLGLKPLLRLEWQGQDGRNETEQPDHSASLGDSTTASTRNKVFGTHNLPAIAEAIAPHGRLALIDDPRVFDIVSLKRKSVSVHWELMFTPTLYQTPDMIKQHHLLGEVADLVDAGLLRTTLTEDLGSINALNLKRVHALVESHRNIGKAVLSGF